MKKTLAICALLLAATMCQSDAVVPEADPVPAPPTPAEDEAAAANQTNNTDAPLLQSTPVPAPPSPVDSDPTVNQSSPLLQATPIPAPPSPVDTDPVILAMTPPRPILSAAPASPDILVANSGSDDNMANNINPGLVDVVPTYPDAASCNCFGVYKLVCGGDGVTYLSKCWADCHGVAIVSEGKCEEASNGDDFGCFSLYDPVCGTDGNTYPNDCELNRANVELDRRGRCDDDNTVDAFPADNQGDDQCDCPGDYAVVCGEDGNNYPNECELNCHGVTKKNDGICEGSVEFPVHQQVDNQQLEQPVKNNQVLPVLSGLSRRQ